MRVFWLICLIGLVGAKKTSVKKGQKHDVEGRVREKGITSDQLAVGDSQQVIGKLAERSLRKLATLAFRHIIFQCSAFLIYFSILEVETSPITVLKELTKNTEGPLIESSRTTEKTNRTFYPQYLQQGPVHVPYPMSQASQRHHYSPYPPAYNGYHHDNMRSGNVDVLYQQPHDQSQRGRRPTMETLTPQESLSVNTPRELLDYCCRFPACYDPLFELCIDTCRKCETEYPVTSWLPCPPLLNIPDCTSSSLSKLGRLPLACYPDIGPFANIIPISTVMSAPSFYEVNLS